MWRLRIPTRVAMGLSVFGLTFFGPDGAVRAASSDAPQTCRPKAPKLVSPPSAYVSAHRPPRSAGGLALAGTRPFERFEDHPPQWLGARGVLRVSAATGEWEPLTFAIVAARTQKSVTVEVSDLVGPGGRISASSLQVRAIRRSAVRRLTGSADAETLPRFLPRWAPEAIARGEFREVWIDIPVDVPPGTYRGHVTVHGGRDRQRRSIELRVRDIVLTTEPEKAPGMYYSMGHALSDEARVRRELADLRAHGVRHLVTGLRVTYPRRGDAVVANVDRVARGLDLVAEAGFSGTIVVDAGFVHLAWALGHDDVAYSDKAGRSLDGPNGDRFREVATESLRGLERVDRTHPRLQLAVAHLDEVFNRGRLDLFVRFAEHTRAASRLPVYATIHTADDAADELRRKIDPLVDVRANHGSTFEWWLERGHNVDDYTRELRRSGDRAWFYHNERGSYLGPRWARVINGLWLWASPFETHVPWAYQRFFGNPLDDTDCRLHDFGVSFPSPTDPSVLIPTVSWRATREGFDDLRYLTTLRIEIERARKRGDSASDARRFLAQLRAKLLPPLPPADVATQRRRLSTPGEAPYVSRIVRRFDGPGLAWLREQMAEHIHTLQTAAGR